jgi:uroporphyrinogen decarboxylase
MADGRSIKPPMLPDSKMSKTKSCGESRLIQHNNRQEKTMSKKQLVLDAFDLKPVARVPVGFWFHFAQESDLYRALTDPTVIQKNIDGHKKFYKDFQPDFVKLMSDGYFGYPNAPIVSARTAADLYIAAPIGADHPWIQEQAELVSKLTDSFGDEVATFYNVFSPATFLRFLLGGVINTGERELADFILEDEHAVRHALNVIAQDLAALSQAVIAQGRATGIYLSVKNVQDSRITPETYRRVISPSERFVLDAAHAASAYNILHICGYEGGRNDLSVYADYDVKAVNWAVTVEGVSLSQGKRLFGGRAVIGGFGNTRESLLYKGSREDIEAYTQHLLEDAGKTGVILGADCTVPGDIDLNRLQWVREKAASL